MDSVLLLVNSAPLSVNARRAWQLARTLHEQGQSVSLFLAQDGVLAALKGAAEFSFLPDAISCYALSEDLKLRGWDEHALREQFQVADYARLVDLFDQQTRVIGAL